MSQKALLEIRRITDNENRWGDVRALLSLLASAVVVSIPEASQVGVGAELPSGPSRPPLFVRTTATGDFAGLYAFVAGEYRRIDNYPNPGEIRGVANFIVDVTKLAPGWYLADGSNGTLDRSAQFVGSAPNYDYAEIQYTGAA